MSDYEIVPAATVELTTLDPQDHRDAMAQHYAERARAKRTWEAYESDWRQFTGWCDANGRVTMPAEPRTVRDYIIDCAEVHKVSTIVRRLSAISVLHGLAGHESPTTSVEVKAVMAGLRRDRDERPAKKTAATSPLIAQLVAHLDPTDIRDVRDRAILLIGFAGALRRVNLSMLTVEDLTTTADGLRVYIARSKTDQEGRGRACGIAYGQTVQTCPVRAWGAWRDQLADAGVTSGPAFRKVDRWNRIGSDPLAPDSIARLVKRHAKAAGHDPVEFAGHSLRSGFATSAARAGVPERDIMRHGGWESVAVMRGYIEEGEMFGDGNPTAKLGL